MKSISNQQTAIKNHVEGRRNEKKAYCRIMPSPQLLNKLTLPIFFSLHAIGSGSPTPSTRSHITPKKRMKLKHTTQKENHTICKDTHFLNGGPPLLAQNEIDELFQPFKVNESFSIHILNIHSHLFVLSGLLCLLVFVFE